MGIGTALFEEPYGSTGVHTEEYNISTIYLYNIYMTHQNMQGI
jgi:hypothetical protein